MSNRSEIGKKSGSSRNRNTRNRKGEHQEGRETSAGNKNQKSGKKSQKTFGRGIRE